MNKKKSFLSVREMVEIALLLAIAIVVDLAGIKIGHASFTMVPLFIIAYRHGLIKSAVVIGLVYAFINVAFDSWGTNPIFLILDYILGFGSLSLAGLFSKRIFNNDSKHYINIGWLSLSIVLCSTIRILCSSISGMIVYEMSFGASFWANFSIYVGWDCLLALVGLIVLYPTLLLLNKRFPTNFLK